MTNASTGSVGTAAGSATAPVPRPRLRSAVVVGTGLIGTSVALALRRRGVVVYLQDLDPAVARAAAALGAGIPELPTTAVDLTVLAVPPAAVGMVLAQVQRRGLARAYTDVASIKEMPYQDIVAAGCDLRSYIGGHPMAGSERSGPGAARADLFEGRPCILTPRHLARAHARTTVELLVEICGGIPLVMEAGAHDRIMAVVSHAPHLISSLMAAQLDRMPSAAVAIAGLGLGDIVRTAGGSPVLWADILSSNADAVADVLDLVAVDLAATVAALRRVSESSGTRDGTALSDLTDVLARGRAGHDRWKVHHD